MNGKSHIIKLLDNGKRLDGRSALDIRQPLIVEYGVSKTAEGSAKVTCGETEVIVGVKMEMGTPYPDSPDKGTIMVGAELLPLSSPDYEPGPPSIKAVELARVVDRGLRESKAIDFKKLCIEKGEKVWIVIIDIVTINDAGGLFDISALAALAALKDAKFPDMVDGKLDYRNPGKKPVELSKEPIAVTVYKLGKYFIVDPLTEEDKAMDARLTITTTADGTICALQKGGDHPLTEEEVSKMIDIASEKSKEYRKAL
ncbi:exosome complex protein Rrp42 [Candidatus Woesearchaeota archaeon]|nr:exosome complex protein Rrp42 [Candidatus Woesearchaeota archaeon]